MIVKNFQALITDMDGVITDSNALHIRIETGIFAEFGKVFPPAEIARLYAGKGTREMFGHFIGEAHADAAIGKKNARLRNITEGDIVPVEGARDFYPRIKEHVRVGLASGSGREFIAMVLSALGLREHIEEYVSSEEVEFGKPHPAVFLLAARRMNVDPKKCFVIEDSPFGVAAARAAGMYAIGLTTAYSRKELLRADCHTVCANFEEISGFLL